jgi:threonine aldolase
MMIDLRSDTVTLPTDAMWEAMRSAPLRDDTLDGDPTVRQLESLAAHLTGKDDALFVASGTLGNIVATLTHGRAGGAVLVDDQAHIVKSEAGGMSRLAGLFCVALPSRRGEMDLEQLHDNLQASHSNNGMPTAMVCVETSHNHSGGYVPGLGYMETVADMAHQAGTVVHVDGARAFNAALALGVDLAMVASHCDSMSFCLSKGLSAPMGSLLVGSNEFIACARTFRRMLGGGLRQSGIMAAAGLVALGQMTQRLADDHRRARALWEKLCTLDARLVEAEPPQTNIVRLLVADIPGGDATVWEQQLEQQRVLTRAAGRTALRLVTHRHIDDADIEATCEAIATVLTHHHSGDVTS